MKKAKYLFYILTVILVIPCLLYYSSKFYIFKELNFGEEYIIPWMIIVSLIIFNLIVTLLSYIKIYKLEKSNEELKEIIIKHHYEELNYMQNTRELFMEDDEIDRK